MSAAKYCPDPDNCTYSDCPTAFCDKNASTHSPAPPCSAATPYIPAQCLREEVRRFKATNRFTPMEVTGFYVQAAVVLDEHADMLKTLQRIDKLCEAWMDLDPTIHDDEDLAELAGKVIKQIAELAVVELARIPQPPNVVAQRRGKETTDGK